MDRHPQDDQIEHQDDDFIGKSHGLIFLPKDYKNQQI
jgi:hypothetical protein